MINYENLFKSVARKYFKAQQNRYKAIFLIMRIQERQIYIRIQTNLIMNVVEYAVTANTIIKWNSNGVHIDLV